MKQYLAIDMGAESGRAILGTLENRLLTMKEIYRFPNTTMNILGSRHWNIYQLYQEIITALKICAEDKKVQPESIGIDTWGVDYGLLNSEGYFLGTPYTYRDQRTDGAIEEFSKTIPRKQIYDLTGIQLLQLNTLFQLFAETKRKPSLFNNTSGLLFMPDIFNYLLTGIKKSEFSFATTSQLYNPLKDKWENQLFEALNIPASIMQEIVQPGTIIGRISDSICRQTGINKIPVVAVASHDTGSAIAAIPALDDRCAYISSGTWSLMGIENDKPIISEKSYQYNFTNEGGVGHTFRILKNIMGLWLLQQCKKSWESKHNYTYAELVKLASGEPLFNAFIDPDHNEFFNPPDMPSAIENYCRKTDQEIPRYHGNFVQSILQSLALKSRQVLEQLTEISDRKIEKIVITGGGNQNTLLNQYIANATGVNVVTALSEGTAAGNIMVQAMALGEVQSLTEIRQVIQKSVKAKTYEPKQMTEWNQAYLHFQKFIKG